VDPVIIEPGAEGLGEMLGGLVRGNLERAPQRIQLLRAPISRVNVRAADMDASAGILMGAGRFHVHGSVLANPDLDITADAQTLLALTAVPLRLGMPDVATVEGRAIVAKLSRGDLRVRGMVARLPLLTRLNRLLSAL
jgi:hypothetical protein